MKNSLTLALTENTVPNFVKFVDKYFKHTVIVENIAPNKQDMSNETFSVTIKATKHMSNTPFIFYTLGMCWQEENRKQIIASFQ